MTLPKPRILHRNQIDETKWDHAIRHAANSLPYAYTWYLDAVCHRWMAVVVGDYDHIMPLPVGRKWGILYVYQPLFCQQLGVFYKEKNEEAIELIIKTVLKKIFFVNANLNYDNGIKSSIKSISKKKNLIVDLSARHGTLQKVYNENTRRNIKKAISEGITLEKADIKSHEVFIDFFMANTAVKDASFKPKNKDQLRQLIQQFIIHSCADIFVANDPKGNMCASVIVVKNNNRLIHLLTAAGSYGRRHGGMHFLADQILKYYEGSGMTYDFEGSSVDSIARFYEGFGAVNEPFFALNKSILK